jgi:hypothetical protein
MTNKEKLDICKSCEYMINDTSQSIFDGEDNTTFCTKLNALVRAHLLLKCPEEKW